MVYKILHGLSPAYLEDKVSQRIPTNIGFLRSSFDLTKLQLPKYENTYQYSMAMHWNKLPVHIRTCNTVDNFKTQLKTYYFTQAFT